MKKIFRILIVAVLCVSAILPLASCKADGSENVKKNPTVMTLSLNPEIELILDETGTVVSVNALNEEGNLIIEGSVFVGKSEEEAVRLFIDISKETGFLVSGSANAGENELKIAYSDEDAAKRYEDIQKTVKDYFSEKNLQATVQKAADLTNAYLNEQLEKCTPYIESAKLEAMSYAEKLKALEKSRKETAKLYSEQLKNAYYDAKELALEKAKFEYVKSKADALTAMGINLALTAYTEACNTVEEIRTENLLEDDSPYQMALAEFRQRKAEFLNYRNYVSQLEPNNITDAVNSHLDDLEALLNEAEAALQLAYETANTLLDQAKEQLKTAYDAAVKTIASLNSSIQGYLDEAGAHATEAITAFSAAFEKSYADAVSSATEAWENMKEMLKQGYRPKNQNP